MLDDKRMKEKLGFDLILFLRFHFCFYSMLFVAIRNTILSIHTSKRKTVLVHSHPHIEFVFYMNPCSEVFEKGSQSIENPCVLKRKKRGGEGEMCYALLDSLAIPHSDYIGSLVRRNELLPCRGNGPNTFKVN